MGCVSLFFCLSVHLRIADSIDFTQCWIFLQPHRCYWTSFGDTVKLIGDSSILSGFVLPICWLGPLGGGYHLELTVPVTEARSSGVIYPVHREWWDFAVWLVRTSTVSGPMWGSAVFFWVGFPCPHVDSPTCHIGWRVLGSPWLNITRYPLAEMGFPCVQGALTALCCVNSHRPSVPESLSCLLGCCSHTVALKAVQGAAIRLMWFVNFLSRITVVHRLMSRLLRTALLYVFPALLFWWFQVGQWLLSLSVSQR